MDEVERIRRVLAKPRAEYARIDAVDGMKLLAHLDTIAHALFEPLTLPPECPGPGDRLLAAIEELVRERAQARVELHEALSALHDAEDG